MGGEVVALKRIAVAALVALGGLLLIPGAAVAQPEEEYPPEEPASIELSDASLVCGEEPTTISGSGFVPNTPVDIFFDGQHIGDATPNAAGEFTATVTPPAAAAGQHVIEAIQVIGDETAITASATLTCVAAAEVAFTGANITVGLLLLAGLLLVGGV